MLVFLLSLIAGACLVGVMLAFLNIAKGRAGFYSGGTGYWPPSGPLSGWWLSPGWALSWVRVDSAFKEPG